MIQNQYQNINQLTVNILNRTDNIRKAVQIGYY